MDTHRTPRAQLRVPALFLLVAAAAGCGRAEPGEADRSGTSTDSVIAPADTARAPVVPPDEQEANPVASSAGAAGTAQDAQWTAGETKVDRTGTGAALLRDVRTARHDDFDRVVLDFGADSVPSYRIAYIDRPVRQCGSGEEVQLAGDAWLSVTVQPANAHTEEGEATVQQRERAPGLPTLLELRMTCDFEALVELVAGVASPERYRAFVLASPNRLVIDIRHAGVR